MEEQVFVHWIEFSPQSHWELILLFVIAGVLSVMAGFDS
jgi:hypothetical protein